jgi:hypothetical protein
MRFTLSKENVSIKLFYGVVVYMHNTDDNHPQEILTKFGYGLYISSRG